MSLNCAVRCSLTVESRCMIEEGLIFCVRLGVMGFSPLRVLTVLSKGNY